jgi:hypothetical protein
MGRGHVKRAGPAFAVRYQAGSLNGSKFQFGGEAEHDSGDARQNLRDMQAAARRKGPSQAPGGESQPLVAAPGAEQLGRPDEATAPRSD